LCSFLKNGALLAAHNLRRLAMLWEDDCALLRAVVTGLWSQFLTTLRLGLL
jgi:hypothetical protein